MKNRTAWCVVLTVWLALFTVNVSAKENYLEEKTVTRTYLYLDKVYSVEYTYNPFGTFFTPSTVSPQPPHYTAKINVFLIVKGVKNFIWQGMGTYVEGGCFDDDPEIYIKRALAITPGLQFSREPVPDKLMVTGYDCALRVYDAQEELIFTVKNNGDIILRGKIIGHDAELPTVIKRGFEDLIYVPTKLRNSSPLDAAIQKIENTKELREWFVTNEDQGYGCGCINDKCHCEEYVIENKNTYIKNYQLGSLEGLNRKWKGKKMPDYLSKSYKNNLLTTGN